MEGCLGPETGGCVFGEGEPIPGLLGYEWLLAPGTVNGMLEGNHRPVISKMKRARLGLVSVRGLGWSASSWDWDGKFECGSRKMDHGGYYLLFGGQDYPSRLSPDLPVRSPPCSRRCLDN